MFESIKSPELRLVIQICQAMLENFQMLIEKMISLNIFYLIIILSILYAVGFERLKKIKDSQKKNLIKELIAIIATVILIVFVMTFRDDLSEGCQIVFKELGNFSSYWIWFIISILLIFIFFGITISANCQIKLKQFKSLLQEKQIIVNISQMNKQKKKIYFSCLPILFMAFLADKNYLHCYAILLQFILVLVSNLKVVLIADLKIYYITIALKLSFLVITIWPSPFNYKQLQQVGLLLEIITFVITLQLILKTDFIMQICKKKIFFQFFLLFFQRIVFFAQFSYSKTLYAIIFIPFLFMLLNFIFLEYSMVRDYDTQNKAILHEKKKQIEELKKKVAKKYSEFLIRALILVFSAIFSYKVYHYIDNILKFVFLLLIALAIRNLLSHFEKPSPFRYYSKLTYNQLKSEIRYFKKIDNYYYSTELKKYIGIFILEIGLISIVSHFERRQ